MKKKGKKTTSYTYLSLSLSSGDTGYSPELFKAIGERYAPITLAAIPIGSFMPTHLMQHLHIGPQDAIKVHHDLGNPRVSVGIHWGTFMMSDEHYLAPRQILEQAWESYMEATEGSTEDEISSISSNHKMTKFITTAFGQTIVLD